MYEVFDDNNDHEWLAHLLNTGWVWSNSVKVKHMHGWSLLSEPPPYPERFLNFIALVHHHMPPTR
jgi:hypothetical protein